MSAKDTRQEFDEIVARLGADYPSLARATGERWRRPVLAWMLGVGAVIWALLSVSMVAWGWRGVLLTCSVVAATGAVVVVDARRQRR